MATLTYLEKLAETNDMVEYGFGDDPDVLHGHFVINKNTNSVTPASSTPLRDAERTAGWIVYQMKKRGSSSWLPNGTIAT